MPPETIISFCVMKKILLALLCTASFLAISAQTIYLTFSGHDNNNHHVQINRVVINNLTKAWQENLYWPDTVLSLQLSTGIGDWSTNNPSFMQLSQNIPNPFYGTTQVSLFTAEHGKVAINITDITGRTIISKRLPSTPGEHQFHITLANPGVYFLIAEQNGKTSFIKMINHASRGKNSITYTGTTWETANQSCNMLKSQIFQPFDIGDKMEYIGYAYINGTLQESKHILQVLETSQTHILEFLSHDNLTGLPCPETPTVVDISQNTYNTVQIGDQCWMKENLRTTHFSNGKPIPIGNVIHRDSAYRYIPDNNENNISTYGYLYNWATILLSMNENKVNVLNLCPTGWKIPTFADWHQLNNYLRTHADYQCDGIGENTAKALASQAEWQTSTNYCAIGNVPSQNNITEFSALPAGSFYNSCGFFNSKSFFWCSTEYDSESAWCHYLSYDNNQILYSPHDKRFGYSVRCIKKGDEVTSLPTVSTNPVSDITSNSALCGGDVLADGNLLISMRGICWSTTPQPTISDSHTSEGGEIGSFTSAMLGLESETTYYVRAYATNDLGIAYGNELSFSTFSLPEITTTPASNINANSAETGGTITNNGGAAITARGVCWSTSPNPSINNNHTTDGSGTGSFTSLITGLQEGTLYHVRAYATNCAGTAYGNDITINTPCAGVDGQPCTGTPTVTDYDGNVYNTIQIGCQCWTKENIRTTHFSDGTSIPYSNTNVSYTTPYRSYPTQESISEIPLYGYLYNWPAAMKNASPSNSIPSGVQGICPVGWHVPSNAEWDQLLEYVGSQYFYICQNNPSYIAKALASNTGWNVHHLTNSYCSPSCQEYLNNATGFSAYPAGNHSGSNYTSNGLGYFEFGHHASFWSTTDSERENAGPVAYRYQINFHSPEISIADNPLYFGHSVRCLRD